MELFAEIANGFKPLTISAKKLHFRCLSRPYYASEFDKKKGMQSVVKILEKDPKRNTVLVKLQEFSH